MRVAATRSELLVRREHAAFARTSRDLLEDKRAMLRAEFDRMSRTVLGQIEALEERCARGRELLVDALVVAGPEAIGSAAMAAAGDVQLERRSERVAGVAVEHISRGAVRRARTERGYALSATTARTDAVAEAFEHQVELLLDVVTIELSLRRLAAEIAATTRRVNALEHEVIPRLDAEVAYIALMLVEREREDHVRLMRARGQRDRRRRKAAE